MERKTLKIEDINFWNNAMTYLSMVFLTCGILLGLITIGVIHDSHDSVLELKQAGIPIFIFFCAFVITVIVVGFIFIWQGLEGHCCYYCKRKINNISKRIIVKWSEPTKYSDKETVISEAMHLKCHKKAEKKFKILDSKFSSIEI